MIGIILLLIALACYFRKKTRWLSYVLYLSFLSNGYRVLIDNVIGAKNQDLAIIYTFVIGFYLLLNGRFKFPRLPMFRWLVAFMVFLVFSVFFSLMYYGFTPYQVLQGGRGWLLIFCVPILIRMSSKDFNRVIMIMAYITLITAAIYIAQIVLGRPILPYHLQDWKFDTSTGLIRLYNSPPFLSFFLVLSFVHTKMFRAIWVWRAIFFIALICTLGRTSIFATILMVLVATWMQGGATRLIRIGVVLMILLIPFADIVTDRFQGANTNMDLQVASEGGYEDYSSSSGGTMTFRLALLYERANYLVHRPILEQIFGMGLISDSQPIVQRMYHFNLGLSNVETGNTTQLHSPDIAWVNTVCGLGYGGTAIYLGFLISMTIFFFRRRRRNYFFTAIAAMSLCSYIISFAGSGLSECRTLAIYFMVMSTGFAYRKRRVAEQISENEVPQSVETKQIAVEG